VAEAHEMRHSVLAHDGTGRPLGDGAVARVMIATGLVISPNDSAGSNPLVAVLGGGQLGRMLGEAGAPLGIELRFLDPSPEATARAFGPLVVGELGDTERIAEVARGATVVTYEWEGVPADGARAAGQLAPVRPDPVALDVAQDRIVEKETCVRLDIDVVPFAAVDDRVGLDAALAQVGLPAVLKTRRGGYDGKGQFVLRDASDADAAWAAVGGVPLVLEDWIDHERELSVLAVRGLDGDTRFYPLVENVHADGILRVSRAPAPDLTPDLQRSGEQIATRLLDELGYVGVLAVELFDQGGQLLANEIAPRVHNSGHWTIEGAVTSQFENHLRAILGEPLGSTEPTGHSVMVNCIGTMPNPEQVGAIEGAHLHDYEKQPRPGRKLGHITAVSENPEQRDGLRDSIASLVGLGS
jgi:5-(carboxyamino)imidazole ribonucleotide synthase